jgi:hypothetical protein
VSMKRDRPTAEHLMIIFEPNKGTAMRGTDINRALLAKDHIHTGKAIMDNLYWLIEKGKIAKAGRGLYGIPNVREDGTRYLIVIQRDNTKKIVECGKLKKE